MDELTEALRRTLADPRRALPFPGDPVPGVHRGIRRRRARRAAAAGASLVLVAVAAGSAIALAPTGDTAGQQADDGRQVLEPTPGPSPTPATAEPEPEPSPTASGPAFAANTDPDTGGPEFPGNGLSVVDARVARQDGFDRVVYELAGDGEVAWRVEYVGEDRQVQQGSGDPVPLEGDNRLEVTILGVGYPYDNGIPQYDGPKHIEGADTAVVTQVWLGSVYEGQYDSFVGVSGPPRPFRVFALSNPTRLVIDVRDR